MPGRKYLSPERKIYRLGESSPESTLASRTFSLGQLYPRLSKTTFSPGRGTSRLGENSPERYLLLETILAWANYAEYISYQTIYAVFTTTELLHMSQMTNLTRNSTCIPSIFTYSSCIPEWINYHKLNLNFMPANKSSQMHFHKHILNETLTHKQIRIK